MTVTINGSGTIGGISVGGLNDNIITKNEMATGGAWAPAGTVLQVVQATYSTEVSSSSTTFADTGLTASITPSSASSKILILVSQNIAKTAGNTSNAINLKLIRNSTDLGTITTPIAFTATALDFWLSASFNLLDSPASTSPVTYKTQFANNANAGTVYSQPANGGKSTITLMEIAA